MKNHAKRFKGISERLRLKYQRRTLYVRTEKRAQLEAEKHEVRASRKRLREEIDQERKRSRPLLMSTAAWGPSDLNKFAQLQASPEFQAAKVEDDRKALLSKAFWLTKSRGGFESNVIRNLPP